MTHAARKRATYEDVLAADPRQVAEVVDGVLHTQPRPALLHAQVTTELTSSLNPPFRHGRGGPGGWIFLIEPELHLGIEPDILVPDLAAWRTSRMPRVPARPYLALAPDWVAEVLSPSTARFDRGVKLPIYAREGVGHAWLVDPAIQTVEVLRLDGAGYRLVGTWGSDEIARLEPFADLAFELGRLWDASDDTPT
jgi:Uma2 family endonuclease